MLHNRTIEIGLLANCLVGKDRKKNSELALNRLRPDYFEHEETSQAFNAMVTLRERGYKINTVNLEKIIHESMGDEGLLLLMEIATALEANELYALHEHEDLVDTLVENKTRKDIYRLGGELREIDDPKVALRKLQNEVKRLESQTVTTTTKDAQTALIEYYEEVQLLADNPKSPGITAGLRCIDDCGGIMPGELWTIAATPGGGKTSLGLQILTGATMGQGKRGLMVSLEMSNEEIMRRMLTQIFPRISAQNLRQGILDKQDYVDINTLINKIPKDRMILSDKSCLTIENIEEIIKENIERGGLDIVIIDYLQIIATDSRGNPVGELARISRMLKGIAKENKVAIILFAQLTKEAQKVDKDGQVRAPKLYDLAGSSGAANDSDAVIILQKSPENRSDVTAFRLKYRHGPIGAYAIAFHGETFFFQDKES